LRSLTGRLDEIANRGESCSSQNISSKETEEWHEIEVNGDE